MTLQILDAAIELADQQGLEAVTFRVVAGLVGITHSEMYQYFADKDALLAAMFSRVVGSLFSELQISDLEPSEDPAGHAAVVLRSVALGLRALFTQHPAIVTALTLSDGTRPDFQEPLLAVVNLLERIGIPIDDIATYYQVLEDYTVGSSLYAMFDHPRHLELRRERLATTGHAAFGSVATSEDAIHTHNERAFEVGLDALIQVILQRAGLLGPASPTGPELPPK
jgi:AcrR family transcriptional regulator